MHLRGKAFELRARRGNETETLLVVPHYDFNWQHTYELAEPLPLDGIDALEIVARFDNSAANPTNPDPAETVMWGEQTWEEMALAFFEVAKPLVAPEEAAPAVAALDVAAPGAEPEDSVAQPERIRSWPDSTPIMTASSFAPRPAESSATIRSRSSMPTAMAKSPATRRAARCGHAGDA